VLRQLLKELLGGIGARSSIEAPFYCDYGANIMVGDGVFVNFGAVFLDPAPIHIADEAQLGPGVQLLTADHPREAAARAAGPEFARSIRIGARAWLGGGVVVCPGVTIGDGTVVGAGSVVVRDLPSGVVAAGNPCRVIRHL
jgi:maltose O-acetyltransferase